MKKLRDTLDDASRELIESHIPFAIDMAKHAQHTFGAHVEPDELEGAARAGLCEAALHFDLRGPASFRTVAFVWVNKALHKSVSDRCSHGITYGSRVECSCIDITDPADLALVDTEDDNEESLECKRLVEAMLEKVAQLNEPERTVLKLAMGLEAPALSTEEIAAATHRSVRTVRMIKRNALNSLALLMEEE